MPKQEALASGECRIGTQERGGIMKAVIAPVGAMPGVVTGTVIVRYQHLPKPEVGRSHERGGRTLGISVQGFLAE